MKKEIYSVYDRKAQLYGTPFYASQEGIAIRSFSRAVNDPSLDMCLFPEDFTLYELGRFDDESAIFELNPMPRAVCSAASVKMKEV